MLKFNKGDKIMGLPEEKEKIIKEYLNRKSATKLTKKYNLSDKIIYRWINAYVRLHYGIVWSDNHVHLCCIYEGIRSNGKHYQWKKPDEEHENLII